MTREEMWEEFESQLKSEIRTPITMSYNDSIRLTEMGIKDVVAKWKKRLEQEPCEDAISREYLFKVLDDFCGHDRTATITLDTLADLVYDMPSVNPTSNVSIQITEREKYGRFS